MPILFKRTNSYIQLFLFFLCLHCNSAKAQQPFIKEFWIGESNTPVNVNDLVYKPDGNIWLATDRGLYRFNGERFTLIPDRINQPVTAVSIVNEEIYAGYSNGKVGVVRDNSIVFLKIKNQIPTSQVTSIHSKGSFLCITTEDEGVFFVFNSIGAQFSTNDGLTDNFTYDATLTHDGVMVSTDRGINQIHWQKGQHKIGVLTTDDGLPDNIVRVMQPIFETGLCWIGTHEGGLALYDDQQEKIINLETKEPWRWGQVNDILPINEMKTLVASEDGYLLEVTRSQDSLWVVPIYYQGIKFKKLILDKSGNVWCGTNKGLMIITYLSINYFPLASSYRLSKVTALTYDNQNNIWLTQNNILVKYSLQGKTTKNIYSAKAPITCLYADEKDNIWVGTSGNGLYCLDVKGSVTSVDNIPELFNSHILSVVGKNDHIWVSSLNGVEEAMIVDPHYGLLKRTKHHNKLSGIGSDYVYQLFIDRKDRVWMATDGAGVCMYEKGQYQRWDSSSGLNSAVIYSIAEDTHGNIWAGGLGKGLYRFDNRKWEKIDGLGSGIFSLKGNALGQMVIVHEEGISVYFPSDGTFRNHSGRGSNGIDSFSRVLNCITKDTLGNVYLPFENGLAVFKNMDTGFRQRPDIRLVEKSLFFKPITKQKTKFSHNENHISFVIEGISFNNPENINYRYKLEGYDDNWVYTNDRQISFPQLSPGKYLFRVQVSLSTDFTDAAESTFSFTITKPFWMEFWFISITVFVAIAIGYGYVRLRERNLRKISSLQKERMLSEYEHLKSQVNPHFLFNSLNTLTNLIEEDQEAAMDYTVHLSDLYRNMLSFKNQDLIPLSEERCIINNYMHIQNSRFGDALVLDLNIPEHLLKTKKIVPLALQLLLENAIKHNVVSRSKPLTISVTANDDEIVVRNPFQPKQTKERGQGFGLINIQKRYSLLTKKKVDFGLRGNEYIVILPLL